MEGHYALQYVLTCVDDSGRLTSTLGRRVIESFHLGRALLFAFLDRR